MNGRAAHVGRLVRPACCQPHALPVPLFLFRSYLCPVAWIVLYSVV